MTSNTYDAIIIGGGTSGAKAACSVYGSPSGWPLARRVGF